MSDDLSGFSLMDLFRSEADGQVATLSEGLIALEGTATTAQSIEPLMRAAHSLKGAARIVGLEPAVRIAHSLEDAFVAAGRGEFAIQPPRRRHAPGGRPPRADRPARRGRSSAWEEANEPTIAATVAALDSIQTLGVAAEPAAPVPESELASEPAADPIATDPLTSTRRVSTPQPRRSTAMLSRRSWRSPARPRSS